jgi:hypothetical protein
MSMRRWTPGTVARVAAAGAIVIAMSVASGATESSASEQTADASATYSCAFPSGDRQVAVKIDGTFPGVATTARPIRPRGVTVTPSLPKAALADLTELGATTVTASARLSVTVAQKGGVSTTASWPGLAGPSTPIPDSSDLPLPVSGAVPPTTVKTIGPAAFMAGPLTLVLTPHKADGGATAPATVTLDCKPGLGPPAILATVPVTAPGASTARRCSAARTGGPPAIRRWNSPTSSSSTCAPRTAVPTSTPEGISS